MELRIPFTCESCHTMSKRVETEIPPGVTCKAAVKLSTKVDKKMPVKMDNFIFYARIYHLDLWKRVQFYKKPSKSSTLCIRFAVAQGSA